MGEDLTVDPAVLQQAADGINATVGELSELGTGETGAVGRGLSLLALSPMQAGKGSVQKALETFTERWSWGVRALVQSGNSIAQTLGLAAGRFHDMDETQSTMFKEMFSHVAGDPHLSAEQIDARSWGDTVADNGFNQMRHADYSGQSFEDAAAHIGRNAHAIGAVTPEMLTNNGYPRQWNTGAAAQAAQIMNDPGGT